MKKSVSIKKTVVISLHALYVLLREIWSAVGGPRHVCPLYPSCGTYIREVFITLPFYKAVWYSLGRIVSCHPWQKPHIDLPPVT